MKQVKVKREGYYTVGNKTVYVKKGQILKVNRESVYIDDKVQ